MYDNEKRAFIAISKNREVLLLPKMANRHGLITGATGTGKTITLQTMAETFSQMGVPVFAADAKGDLSGVAAVGGNKNSVKERVESYNLVDKGFQYQKFPVQFWDVFGEQGIPIRAKVTDMGPLLLGRLLNLNDTQSAVLTVVFKIAQDKKWAIIDFKDLTKVLEEVGNNAREYTTNYGNISAASIGAIQRGLIALEHDGVSHFFGEPDLNIDDLLQTEGGKGVINVLAADKLMHSPKVYSTFLMWLLTKLFEVLPEVGDMEKPKLVFFFDEAHMLFTDAPKALVEKVEQTVRLIRSKGVGVYFISQNPSDMPDTVLSQLGNRVQHALRAYTPSDQKALRTAAQSFRANPNFDTAAAISELGTGEALVSFLDEKGAPQVVERANILPPQSYIGIIEESNRNTLIKGSLLYSHYNEVNDRESAFEIITEHRSTVLSEKNQKAEEKAAAAQAKEDEKERKALERQEKAEAKEKERTSAQRQKFFTNLVKTVIMPIIKIVTAAFITKKVRSSGSGRTNSTRKK